MKCIANDILVSVVSAWHMDRERFLFKPNVQLGPLHHFLNIGERITVFGFVVGKVQVNAVTIPLRIGLMFCGT